MLQGFGVVALVLVVKAQTEAGVKVIRGHRQHLLEGLACRFQVIRPSAGSLQIEMGQAEVESRGDPVRGDFQHFVEGLDRLGVLVLFQKRRPAVELGQRFAHGTGHHRLWRLRPLLGRRGRLLLRRAWSAAPQHERDDQQTPNHPARPG